MAAAVAPAQTSRLLALLGEDDRALQEYALRSLHNVVDSTWAEASELIATIEALSEDESLPAASRQLAAAVASKVRRARGRGGGWRARVPRPPNPSPRATTRPPHRPPAPSLPRPAAAAQIYYHLEEYGEAVRLALGSGSHFDIEGDRSQYTETMLGAQARRRRRRRRLVHCLACGGRGAV